MALTEAHQELRDTDATVNELGFHSANAIVSQIVNQLRNEYTPPTDTPQDPEVCRSITEAPPPIQVAESISLHGQPHTIRRKHCSTSRPTQVYINDDYDGQHGIHDDKH